ncbi:MAG: hypothetical protein U5J98_10640 [Halobacteriales archaeon]|nr:hypothetical protein [Halobacteriales archaeon]
MVSPRVLRNLKREFRRSALAKTGLVLVLLVLFVAVFAPFVAPHNPTTQDLDNARLPPLGFTRTVETGRPRSWSTARSSSSTRADGSTRPSSTPSGRTRSAGTCSPGSSTAPGPR